MLPSSRSTTARSGPPSGQARLPNPHCAANVPTTHHRGGRTPRPRQRGRAGGVPGGRGIPHRLVLGWCGPRPLHVVVAQDVADDETIVITVYESDPSPRNASFRWRRQRRAPSRAPEAVVEARHLLHAEGAVAESVGCPAVAPRSTVGHADPVALAPPRVDLEAVGVAGARAVGGDLAAVLEAVAARLAHLDRPRRRGDHHIDRGVALVSPSRG